MGYKLPEMEIIEFDENVQTILVASTDVSEDGNLPSVDLSGVN